MGPHWPLERPSFWKFAARERHSRPDWQYTPHLRSAKTTLERELRNVNISLKSRRSTKRPHSPLERPRFWKFAFGPLSHRIGKSPFRGYHSRERSTRGEHEVILVDLMFPSATGGDHSYVAQYLLLSCFHVSLLFSCGFGRRLIRFVFVQSTSISSCISSFIRSRLFPDLWSLARVICHFLQLWIWCRLG